MPTSYLTSARKQFEYYRQLGEKTFAQLPDKALFWQYNPESNSIATIVKHLWGNMLQKWNEGWSCLFQALNGLGEEDLERIVYIRNMGHTVMEAINRQLAHYPCHIGQIIYIGKMAMDQEWTSLSIPRGQSGSYNAIKFSQPKERKHFTDDFLDGK